MIYHHPGNFQGSIAIQDLVTPVPPMARRLPSNKSSLISPVFLRIYRDMNWLHWSLLSAMFAGLTAVLAKAGVAGVDSNLATAVRTTVILVFAWAIVGISGKPSAILGLSGRTWWFLVLSGIATGASWLCYFRALQLGEASRVAPVDKLSVVFVILLAAVFLKEKLTVQHLLGGILIVAGAVVLAWQPKLPS